MDYAFDKRYLESEMIKLGISRKDLASTLGISYTTINTRFNNMSSWQFTECMKIQETYFPNLKVESLFVFTKKTELQPTGT